MSYTILNIIAVGKESDDELSTGAGVAISTVVTFIITLVVTALVTYIITSLYYKYLIKKLQVKDIKSDDPDCARGATIKMDTYETAPAIKMDTYENAPAIKMDTNPAYAIPTFH